jgi:hypothetical protein
MKIDCSTLPVMKGHCATCPFKPDEHGIMRDVAQANQVIERTLFKAHQICHSTEGPKRQPRNRCKGSFDFNYTIYERLGYADLITK